MGAEEFVPSPIAEEDFFGVHPKKVPLRRRPQVVKIPLGLRRLAVSSIPSGVSRDCRLEPSGGEPIHVGTFFWWTPKNSPFFHAPKKPKKSPDDRGASITQSYTLNVTTPAVNSGPVISSQPPLSVLLGTEYIYLVSASEANGAALNYALPTAPAGMSITSTGQITWTPTATQVGSNSVTLTVSDAHGNTVTQSFTVNVNTITSPVSPPVITSTPPTFAILGQTYGYNATGSDPNGYALARSLGGPAATLLSAGDHV